MSEVKSPALPSHLASFFVHCSSFTQTLILLHTSVRLHQYGEDEAALGLKKKKKIHSSTTDLMIQFQLCYTSNSTRNGIWAQSIIGPRSVPLNWGKLTFTSCINWPSWSTSPGRRLSLSVTKRSQAAEVFLKLNVSQLGVLQSTLTFDLPAEVWKRERSLWHAVNYQITSLKLCLIISTHNVGTRLWRASHLKMLNIL